MEGAAEALKKITWAMAHAGDIAVASPRQQNLGTLEGELAKKQQHGEAEE
jgi:hypothetical protein